MFRLAFRQTEGLIGSLIGLLGLTLRVPDHTTLSRRAATLEVPRPRSSSKTGGDTAPVHLLVDSTGLKLCGPGAWLLEKHGTRTRRSWRKLHLGVDADTGQIVATVLTTPDVQGKRMKVCDPIAGAFQGGHRCGNPAEPSNRRGPMAECRPILGINRLHAFALRAG